MTLPEGEPADPPSAHTVHWLAAHKDELYVARLQRDGPRPFPSSVTLLRALRAAVVPVAVASASHHARSSTPPVSPGWSTRAQAAIVEDAEAGVEAGRRGGFGLVVGIVRQGDGRALRDRGADLVVGDLGELLTSHERCVTADR